LNDIDDTRNLDPSTAASTATFPVADHRIVGVVLRAMCVVVLVIILIAGLWPFHAPKNEVVWLREGNGVRFGRHGSIMTESPLGLAAAPQGDYCTVELWLEPAQFDTSGTIFAFYDPALGMVPFSVRQFETGLAFIRKPPAGAADQPEILVSDVFAQTGPVFVTIRSGKSGMSIDVNGNLLKRIPYFNISSRDMSGQLVVGDSATTTFGWSGTVKGLAIFDAALSDDEARQEFASWTKTGGRGTQRPEGLVASYAFGEGHGSVIHNQVASAPNLIVPEHFTVLHQLFLKRPWDEYSSGWHYWKDVAVNIVGFIPFGLCFGAYLGSVRGLRQSDWLTLALAFCVSLTIELLQSRLPTRDSGMTDLITNTSGAALGVALWAWILKRAWIVAHLGFQPRSKTKTIRTAA
jgi:VanZ family protein